MRRERPGEFERIAALVRALPAGSGVVLGPGDDAAVLRPARGCDLVVTTDAFEQGRHWSAAARDPRALGRRLAAANLSDLAAMAARPRWALVACAAPRRADPRALHATELACARALAAEGAAVVGGNLTARDGPASWCVTLIGEVARGRHWTRAGARPGDLLAVTGFPGRAGAALLAPPVARTAAAAAVLERLRRLHGSPRPRVRVARALAAAGGVRAAIDLSDGLAGDLARLCAAGGVGATIEAAHWPRDPWLEALARALAKRGRREPAAAAIEAALERLRFAPSDDYELLLAIDPARVARCAAVARAAGAPLSVFGCVTRARELRLLRPGGVSRPLPGRGHDHFR